MAFRLSLDAKEFLPSSSSNHVSQRNTVTYLEDAKPGSELTGLRIRPNSSVESFALHASAPEFVPSTSKTSNEFEKRRSWKKPVGTITPASNVDSINRAESRKDLHKLRQKNNNGKQGANNQAYLSRSFVAPDSSTGNSRTAFLDRKARRKPSQFQELQDRQEKNREIALSKSLQNKFSYDNNSKPWKSDVPINKNQSNFQSLQTQATMSSVQSKNTKSWCDVVRNKPILSSNAAYGHKDVVAKSEDTINIFSHKISEKMNVPKPCVISVKKVGEVGTNVELINDSKICKIDGRSQYSSPNQQSVLKSNKRFEKIPEWRQLSRDSSSSLDNQNKFLFKRTKKRENVYNARIKESENCRLGFVPKTFANNVKRTLFKEHLQDSAPSSADALKDNLKKSRGWYQSSEFIYSDSLTVYPSFNSGNPSHRRSAAILTKENRKNITTSKKSTELSREIAQNVSSSFTSRTWRAGYISNVKDLSYSKVAELDQTCKMKQENTPFYHQFSSVNRFSSQTPLPEDLKWKEIMDYKEGGYDDAALSVKVEEDDSSDWVDEEGWITVKEKSKQKSVKAEKKNANQVKMHNADKTSLRPMETNRASINLKNNKTVRRKEVQQNASNERTSQKKSNYRKKKKRKDTVLYDNDEKKIKEFKMRQLIEESLKQDLLELTRSKSKNAASNSAIATETNAQNDWPTIGSPTPVSKPPLSYMQALIKIPVQMRNSLKSNEFSPVVRSKLTLSEVERQELRRAKLKEKRKQKKKQKNQRKRAASDDEGCDTQTVSMLRTAIPLDLGSMFDKLIKPPQLEKEEPLSVILKQPKRNVVSTGVISVARGLAKKNKSDGRRTEAGKEKAALNALDASQPLRMRGKEREKPKKKKITLLKRVIMREREAKRLRRELEQMKGMVTKAVTENKEATAQHSSSDAVKDSAAALACSSSGGTHDSSSQSNIILHSTKPENKPANNIDGTIPLKPLSDIPKEVLSKIHNRKFRTYCDHFLSKDIDQLIYGILKDLLRFQTRAFVENPIKAKARRRFVLGLREVHKHIKMRKLKCVVIASNLEQISAEGGIDDMLSHIIAECRQFSVPITYSMSRQALGKILNRKVPVSAIGIFNYDGAEENFHRMKNLVEEQREIYKLKVAELLQSHKDCLT